MKNIRKILAEEGINKSARGEIDLTGMSEDDLVMAVIRASEGTKFFRDGDLIGVAVSGGYAYRRGSDVLYTRLELSGKYTMSTFTKNSLKIMAGL